LYRNDNYNPFDRLLSDLKEHVSGRAHKDVVFGAVGEKYVIAPSGFIEIRPDSSRPKKMAFVDGGNNTLYESPDHLISLNRTSYTLFQGREAVQDRGTKQRTEFLSCVVPRVGSDGGGYVDDGDGDGDDGGSGGNGGAAVGDGDDGGSGGNGGAAVGNGGDGDVDGDDGVGGGAAIGNGATGKKRILYDTRVYPSDSGGVDNAAYLPEPDDLLSCADGRTAVILASSPVASLARRLAEIKLATAVVANELDCGDVLVMDGSLHTEFGIEQERADCLYDMAVQKGVIVCGLVKATRLITESGDPLLARVADIAKQTNYDMWHVKITDQLYSGSRGFILAVKLHPNSRFVFRLEILREQFLDMSADEQNVLLGGLALNSGDAAMPGYPYGASVADKYAQVRTQDAAMYRRYFASRLSGDDRWRGVLREGSASIMAHDMLNKVTG